MRIETVISGDYQVNCYLIYDDITKAAIIIDPGQDGNAVISEISKLQLKPELLINTHGHFDHIISDDIIRNKYAIPLAIHSKDVPMIADSLKNGSALFGLPVEIKQPDILFDEENEYKTSFCLYSTINTPGHSQGSACILIGDNLFSGDTLFNGSIGRTDLPGGNSSAILKSLEKLKRLDTNINVYPGHGPDTTIAGELSHNPFFR